MVDDGITGDEDYVQLLVQEQLLLVSSDG